MVSQQIPGVIPLYKDYIKTVLSHIKLEHNDVDIDSIADSILKMDLKLADIYVVHN
ncbi:hypothetical protein PIROE2DRAFT_4752 [Piromyces sp. E2]|nr:hypothetical protein PIROE2DRAFT_4752 [Piromyces sp. E2]|eukprot:OUM67696.1 hypothetical protein PIROE2DRAFT_4752 [Piromyces sp. E2]